MPEWKSGAVGKNTMGGSEAANSSFQRWVRAFSGKIKFASMARKVQILFQTSTHHCINVKLHGKWHNQSSLPKQHSLIIQCITQIFIVWVHLKFPDETSTIFQRDTTFQLGLFLLHLHAVDLTHFPPSVISVLFSEQSHTSPKHSIAEAWCSNYECRCLRKFV